MRDIDLRRNLPAVLVVLGQEVEEGFGLVPERLGAVQGAPYQLALAELHQGNGTKRTSHLYGGIVAALRVGIVLHHLRLGYALDRHEQITLAGGDLVLHFLRSSRHFLAQLPLQVVVASGQESADAVYAFSVLFLGHLPAARCKATAYVVVQTGLLALFHGCGALSQREQPVNEVHVLVDLTRLRIRAEVFGSVLEDAPCGEDLGEVLLGYADHRIALSILQQDVVVRVVLLYQVVLENQRLVVVSRYHMVDVAYLLHKRLRLAVAVGQEVLAHALSQAFGLAHVDDDALFVLHQIASGVQRQGMGLGLRLLEVLPAFPEIFFRKLSVDLIAQTGLKGILVHADDCNALEEKKVVN